MAQNPAQVGKVPRPPPVPDEVEKAMGTLGRWHLWIIFAIFLVKFPTGWHQLAIVIQAPPADFECADSGVDPCSPSCSKHVFNRSIFKETIITQWDLVCARSQLANAAQLITMVGIMSGNMVFGIFSDKYGRRVPLIVAVTIQLIAGCAMSFAPWFWLFLVCRFFTNFATGGTMITSFVLLMELIGIKWRTIVGVVYQIPFNLGNMILAPVGYFCRDWRHMQLCLALPSLLYLSYYCILPESPRWLIAVERPDPAIEILERVAKRNGLPTETIRGDIMSYYDKKKKPTGKAGDIRDVFRTPNIRRNWFCIAYNWIICGLCFFGVAQFMGQLAGNIFLNIVFSAILQVPGTLFSVWSVKAWGRRNTLIAADLLAGIPCLVKAFLSEDLIWPRTMCGSVAMFGLSIAFPTVYVYTGELFPTIIRNIGVGSASMSARIGSMLAPFVTGLSSVAHFLPPIIFGVVPLIGVGLCLLLPETLDCKLPDTVEEAENFGRKPPEG